MGKIYLHHMKIGLVRGKGPMVNMKTALWKDLIREIWRSLSRFISIFAIVFIGVGFFAGIKATAPDMKHSMDLYYDEYNLMDIRIMSTLGLTTDDISAIRKAEGVEDVQPGYSTDAVSTIGSTEAVFRIHSIPAESLKGPNKNYINRIKLTEGRYPQKSGECIVEESLFMDMGISVGDTIKVSSGKTQEITNGILAVDTFTIVGKAVTPYYLSYEKGSSEIGSGKVNLFLVILDSDFAYPVYTEAVVTVKNARELNSYGRSYKKLVSKVATFLENIGADRSTLRLGEIKKAAMDELEKARKEYNEQKQRFTDEMKKVEEELNAAQVELVDGEAKLETEKKNFEANYSAASKQIAEGEKELAQAEREYASALKQYNQTMAEYGDDLEDLDNATQRINDQRADAQRQINELNKRLEDPNTTESEKESIRELIALYEDFLAATEDGVDAANGLNSIGQKSVKSARAQLNSARRTLDQESAELAKAKSQLAAGKKQAEAKFAASEKQIKGGWEEYKKGKSEYEKQKTEGQKKLDEGQEKIIRAENEIEKLSKPQWFVLDRNYHYSFVDYGKTADQIDSIARIFPVFFFLVASLVCLTTMTRMVDEQRGIIGAYKALGYSSSSIALKFVLYAATASFLGGALGLGVGMKIFPEVIYKSWSMMYTLPPLQKVLQVPLMIVSILVGILVTTLSALGACYKELKETPALLMRPKAPKAGKKILLERIHIVWRRLSFSQKVTARNLFRYKKRFYMAILGIAGCTALLLAAYGLSNSISQIVNKQYKEIFSYSVNVKYKVLAGEQEQKQVISTLDGNDNVESYLTGTQINAKVRSGKDDISATLIIPSDKEKFKDYITLRQRVSQKPIEIFDKGIIINEKLAKELNVGIGDAIELDNGDGARKKVEVSGITENYVFHYSYMSREYYKEIFRLDPKINDLIIKLKETSPKTESEIGSLLIKDGGVASVEFYTAAAETFEDMVKILNSIVIVIIISAGLLAFVVLYNLTNINIGERIREIATIKVLGFYNNEVSAYVYRENIILSIIGSILGLFIGIVLHRSMMVSLEQDGVMFGNHIEAMSFLYAFLITMGFVVLVNIFMYRRLKNIPMVESLKSVE